MLCATILGVPVTAAIVSSPAAAGVIGSVARPAQTAPIGTLAVDRACYVNTASAAARIRITGSGWDPGDTIVVSDSRQLISVTTSANVDGGFAVDVSAPEVDPSVHAQISDRIEAIDSSAAAMIAPGGAMTAYSQPFLTTAFAVIASRAPARPPDRTIFTLSGFTAGRTAYAHDLDARGRLVRTVALGRPSGACGLERVSTPRYPGAGSRAHSDSIQFDQSRRYRPHTTPRFVLGAAA